MCGIAGFSGIKNLTPQQARLANAKMKLLGMYNQSRGIHGCGLYINGVIHKGIDDTVNKKNTKEFDEFLSNEDFIWPELDVTKTNLMFLHTRQATYGAHVEANTHPFRVKSQEGDNDLIGVHNGTIEAIWTGLCVKYGIDHVKEHIGVDSKALYTIIERHGLEVLNEYKGFAALLWTRKNDPNSLFVYHGASRKDRITETLWEERPMNFLRTAEGLYFSSMPESLRAIRDSKKQEVEELEHNVVFKVTNGKFTSTKVAVSRADANLTPIYTHTPSVMKRDEMLPVHTQQGCRVAGSHVGFDQHRNLRAIAEESSRNAALREARDAASKGPKSPSESLVWRETCPPVTLAAVNKETIRFYQGRYRRVGGKLCDALLFVKDRGIIGEEGDSDAKPVWFWQGVMLRDQECYELMVLESKVKNSWVSQVTSNWAYNISRYSKYPVTNLESEAVDADNFFRFSWYYDERIVEHAQMRPEFSGRCYTITKGFCVNVIPSNKDDKQVLTPKPGELFKNSALPGLDMTCGYNETVPDEVETSIPNKSVYDIVFIDVAAFFKVASAVEIQAMQEFTRDSLRQMWHCFPSENEVQSELWTSVRTAVAAQKTIREGLADIDNQLENYITIIGKNPTVIESIEEKTMGLEEKMRFYDRHGHWPEDSALPFRLGKSKGTAVVDAQNPKGIPNDLPWSDPDDEMEAYQEKLRDYHLEQVDNLIAEAHIEQKRHKEDEAVREANKLVDIAVATIHELSNVADDLQAMDDSDYAQDAANIIYKGVETFRHELGEVCSVHHQPDAIMKLNQIVQ